MYAGVGPIHGSKFRISVDTISDSNWIIAVIALFIPFGDGWAATAIIFFILLSSLIILLSNVSEMLAEVSSWLI